MKPDTFRHGVVFAEAYGSYAAKASAQSVQLQLKNEYLRQVKPYLALTSLYGKVIHGYSIAFGSEPSALGVFLWNRAVGGAEAPIRVFTLRASIPDAKIATANEPVTIS